jgi:hypothetical protein
VQHPRDIVRTVIFRQTGDCIRGGSVWALIPNGGLVQMQQKDRRVRHRRLDVTVGVRRRAVDAHKLLSRLSIGCRRQPFMLEGCAGWPARC